MHHSTELLPLTKIPIKQIFRVAEIKDNFLRLKLLEMGCHQGMQIEKIRVTLGRGPVIIKLHPSKTLLALRFEEATQILMK